LLFCFSDYNRFDYDCGADYDEHNGFHYDDCGADYDDCCFYDDSCFYDDYDDYDANHDNKRGGK
jgi:hypothetical protein